MCAFGGVRVVFRVRLRVTVTGKIHICRIPVMCMGKSENEMECDKL